MWWSRNKSKTGLDEEEGSVTKFSGPFYYPSPKTRWFGPSKTFLRALLVLFRVTIEACSSLELQEPHALLLQLRRMCFMIQEVVCRFSNCCCARSWKMKSVESSLPPAVSELTHWKVFQSFAILLLHINCICYTLTPRPRCNWLTESLERMCIMQVLALHKQLEQQQELHTALEKALTRTPGLLPNTVPSHLPAIVRIISICMRSCPQLAATFCNCSDRSFPSWWHWESCILWQPWLSSSSSSSFSRIYIAFACSSCQS